MDQEENKSMTDIGKSTSSWVDWKLTRREAMKYGLAAAAGISVAGSLLWHFARPPIQTAEASDVFKGGGPSDKTWELWQKRGWVKEAYHYLKLGRNVQCRVCPNHCLLQPGDRSHCRNKVNRDGTLYTLAYANPCTVHVDPIEKKPLFHFLPGSRSLSLATAGCVFRCLNCQNWEISQRTPEETKDASGLEVRPSSQTSSVILQDTSRLSLFPQDVVALAEATGCPSISYTYSEPIAYYEYAFDTCKAAREKKIKNALVTCGYIEEESLRDLGKYVDGAHVDLKGFDEDTYQRLNSGKLQPVLDTLKTLKNMGVWFEVVNLVVPTYTDKPDTIRKMCGWLVDNLGPDVPVHFSRFMPMHKLTYLSPTPVDVLLTARQDAMSAGLRYVYVGNVPGLADVENTFCPQCRKAVVERETFSITAFNIAAGKCKFCGAAIPGLWAA
jgi:pyruvate formate lyase activating enzyme